VDGEFFGSSWDFQKARTPPTSPATIISLIARTLWLRIPLAAFTAAPSDSFQPPPPIKHTEFSSNFRATWHMWHKVVEPSKLPKKKKQNQDKNEEWSGISILFY